MKAYLTAILIYVLYLVPLPIAAQTKTVVAKKPPTTVSKTEPIVQTGAKTYLEASEKSKLFSAAWKDGKLPAPFELPADTTKYEENETFAKAQRTIVVDQNVNLLVNLTTAEDENSAPSIVAAILEAGFAIEKSDGTRLKTSGAQGISIPEWQISGAIKLYGQETEFGLDTFSNALKQTFPQLKSVDVGRLIIEDLREDLESDVPAKRFWARYIAGLGKNHKNSYDLTKTGTNPEDVRIDPVQNLLIMTRLAGDLVPVDKQIRALYKNSDQNFYQNVSYSLRRSNFYSLTPSNFLDDDDKGGCSIESNTSILFDYAAIANGAGFGKVVEAFITGLKELGKIAKATQIGNIIKGFGYVNILLNLAKFLITLAAVEVKISMEGDSVTRTKTKTAGERRQLKAELKTDTGKYLQIVNCVRPLLNLVGLDASVPTNGAMSNVKVTWVLLDETDTIGAKLHNLNLDGVPTSGNDQNSNASGGVYLAGTADNFTDNDGIAGITVVGQPQERDLSKEKLTQTGRTVRVATYFQTKTSDPKSGTEVVGTIGDFLGPTISLLLGDKLGGIAGLALEAAYRATWCPSKPFSFTVKDWIPCQDEWQGTVTMQRIQTFKKEEKLSDTTVNQTGVYTIEMQAKVIPDGRFMGTASVKNNDNWTYDKVTLGPPCTITLRSKGSKSGGGSSPINGTIKTDGEQVFISLTTENEISTRLSETTTFGSSCPESQGQPPKIAVVPGKQTFAIAAFDKYDASNPYELKGSKTVVEGDEKTGEVKTVVTWNLHKCR